MTMKIIPEQPTFTLQIGERQYPGFRVESSWEGLTKCVDPSGNVVILRITDKCALHLAATTLGVVEEGPYSDVVMASQGITAEALRSSEIVQMPVEAAVRMQRLAADLAKDSAKGQEICDIFNTQVGMSMAYISAYTKSRDLRSGSRVNGAAQKGSKRVQPDEEDDY